jgi:hypothetical protein
MKLDRQMDLLPVFRFRYHHLVELRERKKRLIRAVLLLMLLRLLTVLAVEDLEGLGVGGTVGEAVMARERVGGRVVAVEDVERPDDERRNGLGFAGVCVCGGWPL